MYDIPQKLSPPVVYDYARKPKTHGLTHAGHLLPGLPVRRARLEYGGAGDNTERGSHQMSMPDHPGSERRTEFCAQGPHRNAGHGRHFRS